MTRQVFAKPEEEAAFQAAYDAVVVRSPVDVEAVDVPTPYGLTRVHRFGSAEGPPVVLLHGGGATSTAWFPVASRLADRYRLSAPDLIGDAGRSVLVGRRPASPHDLVDWVDAVLDGLRVESAALAGHSYGGWIALIYALARPARVRRLALLEPSGCFTATAPAYLLHGVPVLLFGNARSQRRLYRWETRGRQLDPEWTQLLARSMAGHWQRPVLPRRPSPARLSGLRMPTLVLLAGRSRAHDVDRVRTAAQRLLPDVTTTVLPQASHHSVPTEDAEEIAAALRQFLG